MKRPNILITGTPGTGKTQTSQIASELIKFQHINVSELVKEKHLHEGKDEEFDSYILDDDKVCDELEPILEEGGCIVDFHSCELFPERWFDLVLVLRTNNSILYDRLVERQYSEKKIQENVECEIMQVILEEAKQSYNEDIINELLSNSLEDLDSNVERIKIWYEAWKVNNDYVE